MSSQAGCEKLESVIRIFDADPFLWLPKAIRKLKKIDVIRMKSPFLELMKCNSNSIGNGVHEIGPWKHKAVTVVINVTCNLWYGMLSDTIILISIGIGFDYKIRHFRKSNLAMAWFWYTNRFSDALQNNSGFFDRKKTFYFFLTLS